MEASSIAAQPEERNLLRDDVSQEETAQLPETWFSEVPGSLTDSEVRLFALLMVCHHRHNADAVAVTGFVDAPERTDVLGEWVQRVLASVGSTDFGNRLLNATKQRGNSIELVSNALAGLPGVGQIAHAPSRNSLSRYLDRLHPRVRLAGRRQLLGPARPGLKGGHTTRVAHAARRVAELLNGPDRETLADALITYTECDKRPPPSKPPAAKKSLPQSERRTSTAVARADERMAKQAERERQKQRSKSAGDGDDGGRGGAPTSANRGGGGTTGGRKRRLQDSKAARVAKRRAEVEARQVRLATRALTSFRETNMASTSTTPPTEATAEPEEMSGDDGAHSMTDGL